MDRNNHSAVEAALDAFAQERLPQVPTVLNDLRARVARCQKVLPRLVREGKFDLVVSTQTRIFELETAILREERAAFEAGVQKANIQS